MSNKVLVVSGDSYALPIEGLGEITNDVDYFIEHPNEFKLVMFTGGEDVTPSLYGDDSPDRMCWFNIKRDEFEREIFNVALENKILMTGICRGVQFLNVMSGGKMMHHITGHTGGRDHLMQLITGHKIVVNTLHHQMMLPPEDSILIGWSAEKLSSMYLGWHDEEVDYKGTENEAVIFPKTRAFGVQYHPEMMKETSDGFLFYRQMVKNALVLTWEKFIDAYTKGYDDVEKPAVFKCSRTAG